MCSKPKVFWIYAKRIITRWAIMENALSVWNFPVMDQPRQPVSSNHDAFNLHHSIPSIMLTANPKPATTRFGNLAPKPLNIARRWIDLIVKSCKAVIRFDVFRHIVFSESRALQGCGFHASRIAILAGLAICVSGCSVIRELKSPPFPYAMISHERVIGVEAAVPSSTSGSVLKFRLGIVTHTLQLIPTATNAMHIPTISDDFVYGQTFSLSPDTSVKESLQTGWSGQPPPLRMKFGPP